MDKIQTVQYFEFDENNQTLVEIPGMPSYLPAEDQEDILISCEMYKLDDLFVYFGQYRDGEWYTFQWYLMEVEPVTLEELSAFRKVNRYDEVNRWNGFGPSGDYPPVGYPDHDLYF